MGGVAFTRSRCDADPLLRNSASAPHRLDGGPCTPATPRLPPTGSKTGSALSPTPPQGGSDCSCFLLGFSYPASGSHPQIPPPSFQNSSITPPLRGSRRSPSRMAKASAEGGTHKASQRRDLVRRRELAQANLQAKATAVGVRTSSAQWCGLVRRRGQAPAKLRVKASTVGGSHKPRPMARSCAPSRVRTGQLAGEG